MSDLTGKVVLITGANSGIGFTAASAFAAKGARVVFACRNIEKAEVAMGDIRKVHKDADLIFIELDIGSLKSVKEFVEKVKVQETKIDILVNNAGIGFVEERKITEDGFELTMATNHFGHFALTGQ